MDENKKNNTLTTVGIVLVLISFISAAIYVYFRSPEYKNLIVVLGLLISTTTLVIHPLYDRYKMKKHVGEDEI